MILFDCHSRGCKASREDTYFKKYFVVLSLNLFMADKPFIVNLDFDFAWSGFLTYKHLTRQKYLIVVRKVGQKSKFLIELNAVGQHPLLLQFPVKRTLIFRSCL